MDQRDIQPSYYNNPRPLSEPYQGQQNIGSENYPTEKPRVDSRGEGRCSKGRSGFRPNNLRTLFNLLFQ